MAHQHATHIHEGRSPILEFWVNGKAADHGNGTSSKRPEIRGMGMLPVMPDLVNHLGKEICQKVRLLELIPLTPWCNMNKGSIEMSEPYILGYMR